MNDFTGGNVWVKSFYSDCAPELEKAAAQAGWPYTSATPGKPATNGIADIKLNSLLMEREQLCYKQAYPKGGGLVLVDIFVSHGT
jgi:hypothetical protein